MCLFERIKLDISMGKKSCLKSLISPPKKYNFSPRKKIFKLSQTFYNIIFLPTFSNCTRNGNENDSKKNIQGLQVSSHSPCMHTEKNKKMVMSTVKITPRLYLWAEFDVPFISLKGTSTTAFYKYIYTHINAYCV